MNSCVYFKFRWFALVAVVACALSFSSQGWAQTTELKIAVIDTKKVLDSSQAMAQVNQRVLSMRTQFQQEFSQKEQQLIAQNQELFKQKTILSSEVFAQKKADLDKQAAIIRSEAKDRKNSLNQIHNSGLSQVKDQLDVIIKSIVEAKSYDVILAKNTIVYSANSLDITDEVVQKLNAALPAVSIQ